MADPFAKLKAQQAAQRQTATRQKAAARNRQSMVNSMGRPLPQPLLDRHNVPTAPHPTIQTTKTGQVVDPSGGLKALAGHPGRVPKVQPVTTSHGKGTPANGAHTGLVAPPASSGSSYSAPASTPSPTRTLPTPHVPAPPAPSGSAPSNTPPYRPGNPPPAAKPAPVRHPAGAAGGAGKAGAGAAGAAQGGVGTYGQTSDITTAQQIAAAMTNPLIKQITDSIAAKTKAGAGAISGYTKELGSTLAALAGQAGQPYQQAAQGTAATDSALMQAVQGAGTDQANGLAAKLAAIGAPQAAVDQTAGMLGQNAQGAGTALLGKGSASVDALLSQGAAATDYGRKQVGIGGLAGLQAGRDLQMSSTKDLADQVGQVKAGIPSIVSQALTNLQTGRNDAQKEAFAEKVARDNNLIKGGQVGLGYAKLDHQTKLDAAKFDLSRNKYFSDMYGIDASGHPTLAGRKVALAEGKAWAASAKKAKTLTAGQYAAMADKADKQATLLHEGKQNADGSWATYPVADYQTALSRLRAAHPGLRLVDAQAILNTRWTQPGQEGRPALSFQQRQALHKAGVADSLIAGAMWDPQKANALLTAAHQAAG